MSLDRTCLTLRPFRLQAFGLKIRLEFRAGLSVLGFGLRAETQTKSRQALGACKALT